MVTDKLNRQADGADRFTRQALHYAEQHGVSRDSITLTGHSLGGTLVEIDAYRWPVRQAFNAFGAAELSAQRTWAMASPRVATG